MKTATKPKTKKPKLPRKIDRRLLDGQGRKIVCPTCWKHCRLFKKLMLLTFTDDERRKYTAMAHKGTPRQGELPKSRVLPSWHKA